MESLGELVANMVRARLQFPHLSGSLESIPYPLVKSDGSLNEDAFGYINQQLQQIRHFASSDKASVNLSELDESQINLVLECIDDMRKRNIYRGERIGVIHPLSSLSNWQYKPGEIVLWEPERDRDRMEFYNDYSYKTVSIQAPMPGEWRERNLERNNLLCTYKCSVNVPKRLVLPIS